MADLTLLRAKFRQLELKVLWYFQLLRLSTAARWELGSSAHTTSTVDDLVTVLQTIRVLLFENANKLYPRQSQLHWPEFHYDKVRLFRRSIDVYCAYFRVRRRCPPSLTFLVFFTCLEENSRYSSSVWMTSLSSGTTLSSEKSGLSTLTWR